MKIRYADNPKTLVDDHLFWWATPKSGIMRLQNTVAKDAVKSTPSQKIACNLLKKEMKFSREMWITLWAGAYVKGVN